MSLIVSNSKNKVLPTNSNKVILPIVAAVLVLFFYLNTYGLKHLSKPTVSNEFSREHQARELRREQMELRKEQRKQVRIEKTKQRE